MGSRPIRSTKKFHNGSVAQLAEQMTLNHPVEGSIPSRPTKRNRGRYAGHRHGLQNRSKGVRFSPSPP